MAGRDIVEERDLEYGAAWRETSMHMNDVQFWHTRLPTDLPEALFPWAMILNKLHRILMTPTNKDHWLDIQGYAELVLRELGKK